MTDIKINLDMLRDLRAFDKNPLFDILHKFVLWTKTDEGCWWWIKNGARKCLKRKIVYYRGSLTRLKKEEYPFTKSKVKLKKYPIKDYYDFKDLLIEKWLKFINQDEDVKKKIKKDYIDKTM